MSTTVIRENEEDYSPEEYAAMWGADPMYCQAPQLPYDGYMFYNFGSEINTRTKDWLTGFSEAIDRLVASIELNNFGTAMGTEGEEQAKIDIANLGLLQQYVHELKLFKECK